MVDTSIEEGEKLLQALDLAGFTVTTAFWFCGSPGQDWMLLIGSPVVDRKGPLKAYSIIQKVLRRISPPTTIELQDIKAVGRSHETIKALSQVIVTPPGIHNISLSKFSLDSDFFDEMYLYRNVKI